MFKINNFNKKIFLRLGVFSLLFYIFLPSTAQAVTVFATSTNSQLIPKEAVLVTVMLDPEGENINAIEGSLNFDSNKFELYSSTFSSSIVNAWIREPHVQDGKIKWSGIIPGGFSGVESAIYEGVKPGVIFQAVFTATATGTADFDFSDLISYANDGKGTVLESKSNNVVVLVADGSPRTDFLPQKISFNQNEFYKNNSNKVGLIGGSVKIILFALVVLAIIVFLIFRLKKRK